MIINAKDLRTVILRRLRTQSRMSGNGTQKPWLPLRFLNKIYSSKNPNSSITSVFIQTIYDRLHIIVDNSPISISKPIPVNKIDRLEIDNNGNVFCYVQGSSNCYKVLTSTVLNRKVPMIINPPVSKEDALRQIAIDHVTPIDKTLKDFNSSLTQLHVITQHIINNYGITTSGQKLDQKAATSGFFPYVNIAALESELSLIAGDSHYRLISANNNLSKSNLLEYKEIYKINPSQYLAVVEDNNVLDQNGNPAVIYQKLDKTQNPSIHVMSINNITKAILCRLANVPIDYL